MLLGDFNYPNIWSNASFYPSPYSSKFINFLQMCADFNLSQVVTQQTRNTPTTSSVLDPVLTTSLELVVPSYLHGLRDHALLPFTLNISVHRNDSHNKYTRL